MSVNDIITESINKNPLGLKEHLQLELNSRIGKMLEAKMNKKADSDDDEKDQKEDEEAVEQEKKDECIDEAREESPIAGTRKVSSHKGEDGHHAEVRYNPDWEEYSVHHYHNGKHMGEGPVSYHGSGKEGKKDAVDSAEHAVKHMHVKDGSLRMKKVNENVTEAVKKISRSYFMKHPHYVKGLEGDKSEEPYVSVKSKKTGGSYKVKKSEVGTVPYAEEVEQIDELSKDTLTSYAIKAHRKGDMAARMSKSGDDKEMANYANKRFQGVQTAIKKLGEESELDEVLDTPKAKKSYRDKAISSADTAIANKDKKTLAKRDRGLGALYDKGINAMNKRSQKIGKDYSGEHNWNEEAEQIDEISTDLVNKYANKASQSIRKNISKAEGGVSLSTKDKEIDIKRSKGLDMADDKLTKRAKINATESVEQIDEISNKTIIPYLNKASVSQEKAQGHRSFKDATSGVAPEDKKTHAKRSKGIGMAVNKMLGLAKVGSTNEEVGLEETVLKYGKEYVDNKINDGEWKFLQGSRRPGGVFTIKDVENNKVMAIMYK